MISKDTTYNVYRQQKQDHNGSIYKETILDPPKKNSLSSNMKKVYIYVFISHEKTKVN